MHETDIAIVGMSGRFPGARTLEEFWTNLREGVESVRVLSEEELLAAGVSPAVIADPSYVRAAAVLDDVGNWDAGFWGFTPKDASIMDPQHRLFLECAWEALENAGHTPAQFDGPIGVYAGCGMQAYMSYNLLPNSELMNSVGLFLVRHTGNDKDFLATRVSYNLNLTGPSINVQTACSTSLVAVHLAVQSLLNNEVDMALAGGVTIEIPHGVGYHYRDGEILSPDGHCRAFDADSRGTVFGSGAGVVVLRRLADAIADGDDILAVVRGSAVNNDGSTKVGYLAPSVDGQAASIVEALGIAEVGADTVTYVETHGTGTAIGDPIEVTALTRAFQTGTDRTGFCGIGSLKTNIGHVDTAAGVASLIKVVLALRNREIPPSLNYRSPNPMIDFAASPFYVNSELKPWVASGSPLRAGVSSLGVGGTNAHVVVEEAPARAPGSASREWSLIQLSAKTPSALDTATGNLADFLVAHPDASVADVAYTLQVGRQAFRERRSVVAHSVADAVALLELPDSKSVATETARDNRSVAFMFAGGGAQYATMGAQLYESEKVFRDAVNECLGELKTLLDFDISSLLYPAAADVVAAGEALERPSRTLPALFVTQYACARLWMSWGVNPSAMIGHSMGEYTAAHLAGVFSLRDALALVCLRGRLFETIPEGGMLSVPLSAAELRPMLGVDLSLAAENAPELSVASGPVAALERLEGELSKRDIDSHRIRISIAAHSSMLEPILQPFEEFLRTVSFSPPKIPFVSNLSGAWITAAEAMNPRYWVDHLRNTVRFADGIGELCQDPDRLLLEVGPGRVLATLARQHPARTPDHGVFTSMRHPDEPGADLPVMLTALGGMWAAGAEVSWKGFYRDEHRLRVALPTYPFERRRHWIDAPCASIEPAASIPAANERQADIA
ncbi:MAG: type I polyketide synthase, partial [Gemmatimonadaceae bacterium]